MDRSGERPQSPDVFTGRRSVGPTGQRNPAWGTAKQLSSQAEGLSARRARGTQPGAQRSNCLHRPKVCRPNGPEEPSLGHSEATPQDRPSPDPAGRRSAGIATSQETPAIVPSQAEGLSARRARGAQPGAQRSDAPGKARAPSLAGRRSAGIATSRRNGRNHHAPSQAESLSAQRSRGAQPGAQRSDAPGKGPVPQSGRPKVCRNRYVQRKRSSYSMP
jgi:hypothetical protein